MKGPNISKKCQVSACYKECKSHKIFRKRTHDKSRNAQGSIIPLTAKH